MPNTFYDKIVGVTKENEDGRSRQEVIEEDLYEDLELHLEREPDNPYDTNAIAVFASEYGDQVGYLSGKVAEELAPLMDRGQLVTCQVAEITGDYDQTKGVNVLITKYTLEETREQIDAMNSAKQSQTPEPIIKAAPETNQWRDVSDVRTKSLTEKQVTSQKSKPTLKQRRLALPKKTRTWIIIIAIILLLYLCGLLTACTPQIQEVVITQIHTQEVEVTREIEVTRLVVVTVTPPRPTPTSTFQKWSLEDARNAIVEAGLEFEEYYEMTNDDYGLAPMNAVEAWRFLIPSLCADCGGRIYSFDDPAKLAAMKEYYDKLGEASAIFFSWTFVKGNILIQISGDLSETQALLYQQALANIK